jgi:N-acetyl sugar amidotransferase
MPISVATKYSLPLDVKYCKLCVTSNQRPRIEWNADGICNACRYAHRKFNVIDWKEREKKLVDLLNRYRRRDGRYDVVVACSGGKDSTAVAHKLKHQYNMHPLTATWAPHIYTDIGWKNFQSFIHSGFDNILGTPNGRVHRTLTKLAFELLGDPFQPFIFGQMAFPFRIAVTHKIPLVFYGENGEIEYGGSMKNEDMPGQPIEDFKDFYFSGLTPEDFAKHGVSAADLSLYQTPSYEELKAADIQMHWFGYYTKWIPQENYYYAAEHCGFKANPDGHSEGTYSKYSSLDDRIDGFHFYLSYIKFGLGRATRDASQEIRSGHLTRDEGVTLVRKYDGEFPKKWFKDFLEYTEISESRFWEVIDSFRSKHLWEKIGRGWELKHVVS